MLRETPPGDLTVISPAAVERLYDLLRALQDEPSRRNGRALAGATLPHGVGARRRPGRILRRLIGIARLPRWRMGPPLAQPVPLPLGSVRPESCEAPGQTTARLTPGSLQQVSFPDAAPRATGSSLASPLCLRAEDRGGVSRAARARRVS